jgi:ATP-binding cassette subfamily C (CFTR/MRP) protein 1
VTYSYTGGVADTATFFASLQLFNVIRVPIRALPLSITAIADAQVAVSRLSKLLSAEDRSDAYTIRSEQQNAIEAIGDFTFESNCDDAGNKPGGEESGNKRSSIDPKTPTAMVAPPARLPFRLHDIKLDIPKGSFVCIMGRIASGKSALLQALLGDMRQTQGKVTFGGTVSLTTQSPWIQSTSIRNNILFGTDLKSQRLTEVINACALASDILDLPDGLETEIGGEYSRLLCPV